MTAPGDVVGQAVVNVRTCADLYRMGKAMTPACQFRIPATPSFRCAGCQGDGTWLDTSNPTMVERVWISTGYADSALNPYHPPAELKVDPDPEGNYFRPVENGDTGDGAA